MTLTHTPLSPMPITPKHEGFQLTALLKATEPRLFEEVPSIRLRVVKDSLGQWRLYPKDVDIIIDPNQFVGWRGGWND